MIAETDVASRLVCSLIRRARSQSGVRISPYNQRLQPCSWQGLVSWRFKSDRDNDEMIERLLLLHISSMLLAVHFVPNEMMDIPAPSSNPGVLMMRSDRSKMH
jgi:hypothetical protein